MKLDITTSDPLNTLLDHLLLGVGGFYVMQMLSLPEELCMCTLLLYSFGVGLRFLISTFSHKL